jgi:dienelactone hydrolase
MKRLAAIFTLSLIAVSVVVGADKDPTSVLDGKASTDSRLGPPKTLNSYFPFQPPKSKEEWETRRKQVREQILVANGLWPMPAKIPLKPVIHSKIDRDGYTIEKVFFASYPGHYVSGNLYRPKGKEGKRPGVLCPHGHWQNGRFYDAGEQRARELIKHGDEKTMEGARYPLQARCANLAMMGCVVFHYDMVGNADSKQIAHTAGFKDARAELHLQSFMGLQTYNSIRALDFLLSLPDVDPKRIGVTGASGGGTQTFILCAVDDRPTVAFPAVMVSTAMQGGCVCENCSYLRLGTGNVEFAGLFAPKPLGMTGAHDWTIDIETKGLPELKALYKLYGAEDKVMAKCFKQFEHNYNQVSREVMYNWFNRHLKLGLEEPVVEKPFVPVPPAQLSVYESVPLPKDAVGAEKLRQYMTEESDGQMKSLNPRDAKSLKEFRRVVGTAVHVMVNDSLPAPQTVQFSGQKNKLQEDGSWMIKLKLSRRNMQESVPAVFVLPAKKIETVVVWIHPEGKASLFKDGKLVPEAQAIKDKGAGILAIDVFRTGELQGDKAPAVDKNFAGYTYGYNRTVLANRVHDIVTAVAHAKDRADKVQLVGFGKSGPWVVLARALCGDAVSRTAADLNQFRFEQVTSTGDEMMLPGALKYGGMPAFAALCAPGELLLHNQVSTWSNTSLESAYKAARAEGKLRTELKKVDDLKVVEWLLR